MTILAHDALFDRLIAELRQRSDRFNKRTVELLLGTDRFVNLKQHAGEKRVGVVPRQVEKLRQAFASLHISLRTYVLEGAGARAGYSDGDYIHAGAEVIGVDELAYLDGPPDVVHALKEPSAYEATIPKPFCRVGALHTGDFGVESGLADLLVSGPAVVFDGSNIGAAETFRIPIRGRMSVFAGEIAAEWTIEHLKRHGVVECHAIVVGGGYAGRSAVNRLLGDARCARIHIFDDAGQPTRVQSLRDIFATEPRVAVDGITGIDDSKLLSAMDHAASIIFTAARPKARAPKTVRLESLARLSDTGLIVDVCIDEGGAIFEPSMRETWTSKEAIPYLTKTIADMGHREYRAISNMPRTYPHKASEAHGEVVLPYLATLLYLAAQYGGAKAVLSTITSRDADPRSDDPASFAEGHILGALTQDLRNGLAFSFETTQSNEGAHHRVVVHDIIADKEKVCGYLFDSRLPFRVRVSAKSENASVDTREYTITGMDQPIRNCLRVTRDRDVSFTFVSHPNVDGTRISDAARALGVNEDDVLKCVILKSHRVDNKSLTFAATVCEGTRRINTELVAKAVGAGAWQFATPEEVKQVTHHTIGGVPVIELFGVMPVYVSRSVLHKPLVWVSAGSEYAGMSFAPDVLSRLGGILADVTLPDGIGRRNAPKIQEILIALDEAMADDDDEGARKVTRELAEIFGVEIR
jgi:alanine dehydrogenase